MFDETSVQKILGKPKLILGLVKNVQLKVIKIVHFQHLDREWTNNMEITDLVGKAMLAIPMTSNADQRIANWNTLSIVLGDHWSKT
jgi:hypothetical protein